jgi:hypothetical protein
LAYGQYDEESKVEWLTNFLAQVRSRENLSPVRYESQQADLVIFSTLFALNIAQVSHKD